MNPFAFFKFVPLSVLQMLARFIAWVIIKNPNLSVMRTIMTNLRLVYPDSSAHKLQLLTEQIVLNQCLSGVESIKCWAMPPAWSLQQIRQVHNQSILTDALNNPKGMLAIVPHLGTWEIMNAWLNQFGSPTIMYKPVKGRLSNDFVLKGRQRLNATLVPTDGQGVKAIFKTLKQGGFSIILPDHVPEPSGGVIAPFFGVDTLTSTLAPKLASKTKCALVGLACIRRKDGTGYDIHCYAMDDPKLYERDAAIATTAMNKALEHIINANFTHYVWGYRRFKYLPVVHNPYNLNSTELDLYIQQHLRPTRALQQAHDTPLPTAMPDPSSPSVTREDIR
jgi:KDO2-lipid IV(A) lauroyltransferase